MAKHIFKQCVDVRLASVSLDRIDETGKLQIAIRCEAVDEDGTVLPIKLVKRIATELEFKNVDLETHGAILKQLIINYIFEKKQQLT